MLEYIIMGMLMEGSMSGYDLKKTIDGSVGTFYTASYGSLYPALKRMTERGQLSVLDTEDSKNKKLYTLLPEGRELFFRWLGEPLQSTRMELLGKIFFYDYLDEDTRQQRLDEYLTKIAGEIGRLRAVEQIVAGELAELPHPEHYYYRVSVLSYGLAHYLMEQEWIRNIKERVNLQHDKPTES